METSTSDTDTAGAIPALIISDKRGLRFRDWVGHGSKVKTRREERPASQKRAATGSVADIANGTSDDEAIW